MRKRRLGIGGHTLPGQGRSDDWITPKFIIDRLGPFDLDPCACSPQPWETAKTMWALPGHDGLDQEWFGRVWLNPPYGKAATWWLCRMAKHAHGTVLIFARTETHAFQKYVLGEALGLLFLRGRLHFHFPSGERAKGNAGGPSVLVAYGQQDMIRLRNSNLPGVFVPIV